MMVEANGGSHDGDGGFFTEKQRLAVETTSRHVLLLAPAGTGKTQVLTAKYVNIARREGERSVIAITFTKKAGRQLSDRIREQANVASGGRNVGWLRGRGSTIGTFHAVGSSIMREARRLGLYDGPLTIANDEDQRHYAMETIRQRHPEDGGRTTSGRGKDPRDVAARELIGVGEKVKNACCLAVEDGYAAADGTKVDTPKGAPTPGSKMHGDLVHLRTIMTEAGAIDFNDVILTTTLLVERHRDAILPNLKAVLVDEYQDTNDPQERMIEALSRGLHLTCVGDDDQAIFEWRGANVENIRKFADKRPNALIVTLDVNYRCPPEILVPAQRLIARNKDRHDKPLMASKTSTASQAIHVHDVASHYRNAGYQSAQALKTSFLPRFTAQVCRDIAQGGRSLGGIACLVRTNAEGEAIMQALREMGIMARVTNPNATVSRQLRRLTAWLRVIENPKDISAIGTLTDCNTGDPSLMDLAGAARLADVPVALHIRALHQDARLSQQRFKTFASDYTAFGALRDLQRPQDVVTAIADKESLDMRSADPLQVSHYWRAYAGVMERVEGATDLDEGIEYLQNEFYGDIDDDKENDAIEVVTTHSMKGRQKPVVVVSAFIDGVFPLAMGRSSDNGMAEERRLAYVAMTRAQEVLHIVSTSNALTTFLTDAGLSITAPA